MVTSTTLPRYTDIELETASLKVKRVLLKRATVYLTNTLGTYKMTISDVRVSLDHLLLQVRIREGWTSVWYSEKLVDVFGDSLYESPCFSLDDLSTVDAFDRFVLEFGLLPWHEVKAVF